MTEAQIDYYARILWDYLRMPGNATKADAIFVLCSLDIRVAEYAAQLFLDGKGDYLIFSGSGIGRDTEKLFDKTEAETFADIAIEAGVPTDRIITEKDARNTGDNLRFTAKLLQEKGFNFQSFILVQKPHMLRRVYATFKKQWPNPTTQFWVTSPPIPYEQYFNAINNKKYTIESMVGDLQRIKEYPKLGYQVPQEIPEKVWDAYEHLVAAGFTRRIMS